MATDPSIYAQQRLPPGAADLLGKALELRNQAAANELTQARTENERQELALKARAQRAQEQFDVALKGAIDPKTGRVDPEKLFSPVLGPEGTAIALKYFNQSEQDVVDLQKAQEDLEQKRADTLGGMALGVWSLGNNPFAFRTMAAAVKARKLIPDEMVDQQVAQAGDDPEKIGPLMQALISRSPRAMQTLGEQVKLPGEQAKSRAEQLKTGGMTDDGRTAEERQRSAERAAELAQQTKYQDSMAAAAAKNAEANLLRAKQGGVAGGGGVPIMTRDADGNLIVVDRGRPGEPAQSRPVIDPATGQPIGKPPTAEMQNKADVRKQALKILTDVETLSGRIITEPTSYAQRTNAIVRKGATYGPGDAEFKTYEDLRFALAGTLAVLQQGSRPSDVDINRIWTPLVPDPYSDTSESTPLKWKYIHGFVEKPPAKIEGDLSKVTSPWGESAPSTLPKGASVTRQDRPRQPPQAAPAARPPTTLPPGASIQRR